MIIVTIICHDTYVMGRIHMIIGIIVCCGMHNLVFITPANALDLAFRQKVEVVLNVGDKVGFKEGENASIVCRIANAMGLARLDWYSNLDKTVKKATKKSRRSPSRVSAIISPPKCTLMFAPVQKVDEGNWTCEGSILGTAKNKTVKIVTYVQPKFVACDKLQQPLLRTNAMIKCTAKSRPYCTIDWLIKGQYLSKMKVADKRRYQQEEFGLLIRNITPSDNGIYYCRASMPYANKSRAIEVKVTVPPNITGKIVSDTHTILGKDTTIICNASVGSPPPNYTWTRKIESLMPIPLRNTKRITVNHTSGTLKIRKLGKGDGGTYICKAENVGGNTTKEYILVIKEPPEAEANDVHVVEKTKVQLVCKGTGDPLLTVKLEKGPLLTIENNGERGRYKWKTTDSFKTRTLLLTITNVTSDDSGLFKCIATSVYGNDSKNLLLNVTFGPRFVPIIYEPKTFAHLYHLHPLVCIVKSHPKPNIVWKRGKQVVRDDKGVTYKITTKQGIGVFEFQYWSNLTVNVTNTNTKLGNYTCEAQRENTLPIRRIFTLALSYQEFRFRPKDQRMRLGKEVLMRCAITDLTGGVQWARNNDLLGVKRSLPDYSRYRITGNATTGEYNLMIKDVKIEDEGNYSCQATLNRKDNNPTHKAIANLYVLVSPEPLFVKEYKGKSIIRAPANKSVVILTCVSIKGRPAAKVTWKKDGTIQQPRQQRNTKPMGENKKLFVASNSLTIETKMLNETKIHRYTCTYTHETIPNPTPLSIIYYTGEGPLIPTIKITSGPNSVTPHTYLLEWKISQNSGLPLLGYKVKYRKVVVDSTTKNIKKVIGEFNDVENTTNDLSWIYISNLEHSTSYEVVIVANYSLGLFSKSTTVITTPEGSSTLAAGTMDPKAAKTKRVMQLGVIIGSIVAVLILAIGGIVVYKKKRQNTERTHSVESTKHDFVDQCNEN